ncbi:hypothetical protein BY458DRAFT_492174 [Sporodiniella umbellata]|nr:hypothetical protein BY458DRAFT_492174 [Sporodiniella umbellata]
MECTGFFYTNLYSREEADQTGIGKLLSHVPPPTAFDKVVIKLLIDKITEQDLLKSIPKSPIESNTGTLAADRRQQHHRKRLFPENIKQQSTKLQEESFKVVFDSTDIVEQIIKWLTPIRSTFHDKQKTVGDLLES